jgi:hypothetical protein
MIFLLIYDRSGGQLIDEKHYADARIDAANEARLEAEIAYGSQAGVEVVILKSVSREDLQKTHARYFKSVKELSPLK